MYIHKDAYGTNHSDYCFSLSGNWKDWVQGGKETKFICPFLIFIIFGTGEGILYS